MNLNNIIYHIQQKIQISISQLTLIHNINNDRIVRSVFLKLYFIKVNSYKKKKRDIIKKKYINVIT